MPLEPAAKNELGPFSSCLVEGDAEQLARERKIKRRALAISVAFQAVLLTAVVIAPLLAKTPSVDTRIFVPIPPYFHPVGDTQRSVAHPHQRSAQPQPCRFCPPTRIPDRVTTLPPDDPTPPIGLIPDNNYRDGVGNRSGIDLFDSRTQPSAPTQPPRERSRVVKGGDVQAALLIYRVNPVYPSLMQQIRKSGRVDLHAIISTDGTIESLQVISGDPGFYQSALEAVRQWRYRPTILNGQAVEVETVITVIYKIGG